MSRAAFCHRNVLNARRSASLLIYRVNARIHEFFASKCALGSEMCQEFGFALERPLARRQCVRTGTRVGFITIRRGDEAPA